MRRVPLQRSLHHIIHTIGRWPLALVTLLAALAAVGVVSATAGAGWAAIAPHQRVELISLVAGAVPEQADFSTMAISNGLDPLAVADAVRDSVPRGMLVADNYELVPLDLAPLPQAAGAEQGEEHSSRLLLQDAAPTNVPTATATPSPTAAAQATVRSTVTQAAIRTARATTTATRAAPTQPPSTAPPTNTTAPAVVPPTAVALPATAAPPPVVASPVVPPTTVLLATVVPPPAIAAVPPSAPPVLPSAPSSTAVPAATRTAVSVPPTTAPSNTVVPAATRTVRPAPSDTATPPPATRTNTAMPALATTVLQAPLAPTPLPAPTIAPTPPTATAIVPPTRTQEPATPTPSVVATNRLFVSTSLSQAAPGEQYAYGITVVTSSPGDIAVTVNTTLDPSLALVSANAAGGSCATSGQVVACKVTIRQDFPEVLTLQVQVRPDAREGASIAHSASVSDGRTVADADVATVTVRSGATATPEPAPPLQTEIAGS